MRRERKTAPASSVPQAIEDEMARLELQVDDNIVVAKKLEYRFVERRVEGGVNTTRLEYCELRKRVEVLCTVLLSDRGHDKAKRKHTILLRPRLVVFFQTFLGVLVEDGKLGVEIADSVWGTIFVRAHGLRRVRGICRGGVWGDRIVRVGTAVGLKLEGRRVWTLGDRGA